METLDAVKAWQEWARKNENYAGDVTVPDSPDTSFWFPEENQEEGARHFHGIANGGDGSLIALWSSRGGDFKDAPVVMLGHEGQVAFLAGTAPEAIALFAAAGSASFEAMVAWGEMGEPDEKLSAFVKKTYGVTVPREFASPAPRSKELVQFLKKITGNEYESYSF